MRLQTLLCWAWPLLAVCHALPRPLSSAGVSWTLSSGDGSVRVTGSVPGEVHTDLMQAGILGKDPYFRYNELNMSWVALEKTWTYESSPFDMPTEDTVGGLWYLKLKGVDSIASIYLNDILIGETNNVFRTFTFPLPAVPADTHTVGVLRVVLHGALHYASTRAAAYPYEVPETENYNVWAEPSHRNMVRKPGSGRQFPINNNNNTVRSEKKEYNVHVSNEV
jgi:beta-mannosidase